MRLQLQQRQLMRIPRLMVSYDKSSIMLSLYKQSSYLRLSFTIIHKYKNATLFRQLHIIVQCNYDTTDNLYLIAVKNVMSEMQV